MANELAPKMESLGASLMDEKRRQEVFGGAKFLPMLKVVYGIEVQSNPELAPHVMKAVLVNDEKIEALDAPYRLTVLEARQACRFEVKKGKFEYAYGPVAERQGKSHEKYLEFLGKAKAGTKGFDEGSVALVAVIRDGAAAIASMRLFKSGQGYWSKILHKAVFLRKGVAVIGVSDHGENLVETDNGGYLAGKKFDQYEIEELTPADFEAVKAAYESNGEAVRNWLAM